MTNQDISDRLRRRATELAREGDNLYRVRAFRQAAMTVLTLTEPVAEVLATRGCSGLERLPGVGPSLAVTIAALAADPPAPPTAVRERPDNTRDGPPARPLRVAPPARPGYTRRPLQRRVAGCLSSSAPPAARSSSS